MRSLRRTAAGGWIRLAAALFFTAASAEGKEVAPPTVGVVRALPMTLAQADAAREGASELVVLMEIARLQAQPGTAGLVGVGNRHGLFSGDAEEALRWAVLTGIPVVKLAPQGEVLAAAHGLFLDGGHLSVEDACRVLASCLVRFGALPKVQSREPRARDLAALQKHLRPFRQEFTLANAARVAVR